MKCRKCLKKAIIYMPEHRLALCSACYSPWFLDYTERTIRKFKMFSRRDRVLVAVSGGKDSLSLWHALCALGYEADGFYIDLGITGNDRYSEQSKQRCMELAEKLDRRLHIISVAEEVGAPIPEIKDLTAREACSACGLIKRYFMNRYALEAEYDVIATGHNLDDEVAVLFSNVLNWNRGYLARQYPVLDEREGLKKKVKPFVYFTEKQTTVYALVNRIAYIRDECPYALGATTLSYKAILAQLEHQAPGTKRRFLDGFYQIRALFAGAETTALIPCSRCGQPTTADVCAYCRLVEHVQRRRGLVSMVEPQVTVSETEGGIEHEESPVLDRRS
ncbi:MAG: TIGR00269 family protein [Blastocatellia bacterium]|nr:TIGR00269 family protein [Blastocatellia bacterium]MCS7156792.1 TIGR00269 family protein [Blastocatellia bacterium]MCX7752750.1 TIGR00269 family protein [Blastocatellia bacterium]MDW8167483.1 TIGR00269 family protein [Acidobacteriota bacterium]MDW8256830.1 TIGR00269 family protein [Acidobacteriota bacterium]